MFTLKELRPLLHINGVLLMILAAAMVLPGLVDLYDHNGEEQVFLHSAMFTGFVGYILYLGNRGYAHSFNLRQTFIFTSLSYALICTFSAVPFYFSGFLNISMVDALFESVSGITTTGASILVDVDHTPRGILLWRALLQGLGGVGIVVLGLAFFPTMRIGGMQLFKSESSDTSDKLMPRATQIAKIIAVVYGCLVVSCIFAYYVAGMSGFHATTHALSTISGGGYSSHSASFAHYDSPALDVLATIFMISGSLPMIMYYQALRGGFKIMWRDPQIILFFRILLASIIAIWLWVWFFVGMDSLNALRHAAFNVTTIMTGTGFASTDFSTWGNFSNWILLMLMFVGGCTGSTAGAIKIFRYHVLWQMIKTQFVHLLQPNRIYVPRYSGKPVSDGVMNSVVIFFLVYLMLMLISTLLLSLDNLDMVTATSASAQALGNVGMGLGDIIGPSGGFAPLSDAAKINLTLCMFLGRLEIFTVLVLLVPRFWRY